LVKLVQRLTDIIVKEATQEKAALFLTLPFSKLPHFVPFHRMFTECFGQSSICLLGFLALASWNVLPPASN
jgi:hypothetical protein